MFYSQKSKFIIQNQIPSLNPTNQGERDLLFMRGIIIQEGILNQIFYDWEVIKNESIWSSAPVTVGHPMDNNNQPISFHDPRNLPNQSIGQMFYSKALPLTRQIEGYLYLEIPKLKAMGINGILENTNSQNQVSISTGLIGMKIPNQGDYNGETYGFLINNIQIDHLAILINHDGACSLNDGCGVYRFNNNKKKEDPEMEEEKKTEEKETKVQNSENSDSNKFLDEIKKDFKEFLDNWREEFFKANQSMADMIKANSTTPTTQNQSQNNEKEKPEPSPTPCGCNNSKQKNENQNQGLENQPKEDKAGVVSNYSIQGQGVTINQKSNYLKGYFELLKEKENGK